ncbi:MAG: hypothetical protein KatS3mg115_1613 [Candidatus Poribacteria bacterium]|nr:MAG: hypothetical protein KatS3mg115_1613 [Candidatus Poribacteria bacterium]
MRSSTASSRPSASASSLLLLGVLLFWACSGAPRSASAPAPPEASSPAIRRGAYVVIGPTGVIALGNLHLQRRLVPIQEGQGLATRSLVLRATRAELCAGLGEEAGVQIGERTWSTGTGLLRLVDVERDADPMGTQQLRLHFAPSQPEAPPFRVTVGYEVAADAPWMRKWIEVENRGDLPLPVRSVQTERLPVLRPERVFGWTAEGVRSVEEAEVPAAPSGWLVLEGSFGKVFLIQEAPGFLRRVSNPTTGIVQVTTADDPALVWLTPGERMIFPGVQWWAAAGDVEAERRAYFEFLRERSRWSRSDGGKATIRLLALGDHPLPSIETLSEPAVALAYAWPRAWDTPGEEPRELIQAVEALRSAGKRVYLWVPVAWIPRGGGLAEFSEWIAHTSSGEPLLASWQGEEGLLAVIESEYRELVLNVLVALVDRLGVDGLLLGGTAVPPQGGYRYGQRLGSRLRAYLGLLELLGRLRSERPEVELGVLPTLAPMGEGFEGMLYPFAFLAVWGETSEPAVWRTLVE